MALLASASKLFRGWVPPPYGGGTHPRRHRWDERKKHVYFNMAQGNHDQNNPHINCFSFPAQMVSSAWSLPAWTLKALSKRHGISKGPGKRWGPVVHKGSCWLLSMNWWLFYCLWWLFYYVEILVIQDNSAKIDSELCKERFGLGSGTSWHCS